MSAVDRAAVPVLAGIDPKLAQAIRVIDSRLALLEQMPWTDGVVVDVPAESSAAIFTVKHDLGRTPIGWIVLDVERAAGASAVWSLFRNAGQVRDATRMTLRSTNGFTALKLWVF